MSTDDPPDLLTLRKDLYNLPTESMAARTLFFFVLLGLGGLGLSTLVFSEDLSSLPEECKRFFQKYEQCTALPPEMTAHLDKQVDVVKKSMIKLVAEGKADLARQHCQTTDMGFKPTMQKYGCAW